MSLLAAGIDIPNQPSTVFTQANQTDFLGILTSRVLLYAIIIAAFYFFVRLVQGGFSLMTSNGDPAKIQSSQSTMSAAVIGLVIVVSAFFIAQILKAVFGINLPL